VRRDAGRKPPNHQQKCSWGLSPGSALSRGGPGLRRDQATAMPAFAFPPWVPRVVLRPARPPSLLPGLGPGTILPLEALAPPGRLWLRPFTHSRAQRSRDGRAPADALVALRRLAEGEWPLGQSGCPPKSCGRYGRRPESPARRPPAAAAARPG